MTRPHTPLMRDLLAAMRAGGAEEPDGITMTAAYAAGRKLLSSSHQIAAALAALVVDGALTTRIDTVPTGGMEIKYWISSTPAPVVTPEEPKMQTTDSKSALLRRLISEHSPITTTNLLGLANAEGGNIPGKSVASLLAGAVKNGTVVKIGEGSKIQWATPDQVEARSESAATSDRPSLVTARQFATDQFVAMCESNVDLRKKLNYSQEEVDQIHRTLAEIDATTDLGHITKATEAIRALINKVNDLQAENTRLDGIAANFEAQLIETAEICRALDVPDVQLAVQEIGHLTAEAARNRYILTQIASHLHCDNLEALPEIISALGALDTTTKPTTPGRLALLLVDGTDSDLLYLEPYVAQAEGEALAIEHVDTGQADRAYLVRALYGARRKIEHGAIAAPAVETLHG